MPGETRFGMLELKSKVLDLLPFCSEHLFVTRSNIKALVPQRRRIHIVGQGEVLNVGSQSQLLLRVLKQSGIVRLQPEYSPRLEYPLVHVQESGASQPSLDVAFLRARIRKCEPYFIRFMRSEETLKV